MGRVRTNLVKKAAKTIIERHFARLTFDFDTNKKIVEEVASIPSKRLRNKIAGFITHLMKRIERGPVKGISLKLQEEERERRMDFVPDRSVLDMDKVEVDSDTRDLLRSLEFGEIHGVVTQSASAYQRKAFGNRQGGDRQKKNDAN